MDIEKELQQKYAELEAIRASINKVIGNAHIESYSATGNSITYREMKDLRAEESRLMFAINQLELIKQGQRGSSIVSTSFRVR
ncbi:hypothetical protein [Caedibacter taeniospiralis]|uniref:hypothetical protein n=1 Tax=Caedibacter taeniospiralis TaxID=28907 RepID=UPI000C27324E|nr:hypothetical protein [Caedibacter taeniospiralis]